MAEPYLILHVVRGQPVFDVAERMPELDEDDNEAWIIPTSGHRAHPYRHWKMDDLYDGSDMDMPQPTYVLDNVDPPADLPDHYPTAAEPRNSPAAGHGLLARLGLLRKTTIKRRV